MSIVLQLQEQAMDSSTPVADLLLKALVVATKLNLDEFKTWVENEQNGYERPGPVPDYRILTGHPMARDCDGLKPIIFYDIEAAKLINRLPIRSSISEIDNEVRGDKQAIYFSYPVDMRNTILNLLGGDVFPMLQIPKNSFGSILQRVRSEILTWTLKLEKDGIQGEGLAFTAKEKAIAQVKRDELKPNIMINIQNMRDSSLQVGSPDGHVTHTRNDK
jgi:hypothetical protein